MFSIINNLEFPFIIDKGSSILSSCFGNCERCSYVDVLLYLKENREISFNSLRLSSRNVAIEKGRHLSIPRPSSLLLQH